MTSARPQDVRRAGPRARRRRTATRPQQSSDLYITDGDQIDWLYAKYRIFTFTYELYPTETGTVWGDHYPDDSKIAAQTARNRARSST